MGYNDHIDFELVECLQRLLDEGDVDSDDVNFMGLIQLVIDDGIGALSEAQLAEYDARVLPLLAKQAERDKVDDIVARAEN